MEIMPPQTYWAFVWLALALISVTLIAIILGFYINIKQKGYSWMIVQDGACTRISPKAWVPFFWGAMCACEFGQIMMLRTVNQNS